MQLRKNPTREQWCKFCPSGYEQPATLMLHQNRFRKGICQDCAIDFARGLVDLLPTLQAGSDAGVEAVHALAAMARPAADAKFCNLVNCKTIGPHFHEIQGPAEAKK
jgi:hypothetical protein